MCIRAGNGGAAAAAAAAAAAEGGGGGGGGGKRDPPVELPTMSSPLLPEVEDEGKMYSDLIRW